MDEQRLELTWIDTEALLRQPPFPPREVDSLPELLTSSVRLEGIISPLLVRRSDDSFQLICGYRRLLAAQEMGLPQVPVLVATLGDVEAIRRYIAENSCRRDFGRSEQDDVLKLLRRLRDGGMVAGPPAEAPPRAEQAAGVGDAGGDEDAAPSGLSSDRRIDIDRDVHSSLLVSRVRGLVADTRQLLDAARERRIVDFERAQAIVEDILELPIGERPLGPEAFYEVGSPTWLESHSVYCAYLNRLLVRGRGEGQFVRICTLAGLLHDVGMVFLERRDFLQDGAPLSRQHLGELASHARLGYALLSHLDREYRDVALAARDHHERRDGSGYPRGTPGHETSWVAQLTALTDTFAAMTAPRPHRTRLTPAAALEELGREDEALRHDAMGLRELARLYGEDTVQEAVAVGVEGRLIDPARSAWESSPTAG